jgi:hypothetical protein
MKNLIAQLAKLRITTYFPVLLSFPSIPLFPCVPYSRFQRQQHQFSNNECVATSND